MKIEDCTPGTRVRITDAAPQHWRGLTGSVKLVDTDRRFSDLPVLVILDSTAPFGMCFSPDELEVLP